MTRTQFLMLLCANLLVCVSTNALVFAQSPADQFSVAAGYYSRGEWTESISAFESLIGAHGQTEQAKEGFFFLGESHLQVDNYPLAKIAYQKFLVYLPQSQFATRASFRLAEIGYRTDDLQATTMLEAFIRENPESELIQFAAAYLGEARLKRREPQLAQHVFEKALSQFPNSNMVDSYRIGLGKSMQLQGRLDEARQIYDYLVLRGSPKVQGETLQQLGLLEFAQSNWQEAISYFEQVKQTFTGEPERVAEVTYWLGRCYLQLNQPEQAISYFQEIAVDRLSARLGPTVYFDGAVAWAQVDQNEKALQWLAKIRENWSNSKWGDEALQLEIELSQRAGAHDDVLRLAHQFQDRYPDSKYLHQVMESMGRVQYAQRDYDKTIETFQSLHDLNRGEGKFADDQRATWNYFIGLGQIGQKDFPSAVQTLDQISASTNDESFQAAVAIAHATALSAEENYAAAVPRYRTYLALKPEGTDVVRCLSELATCEAELKNWTAAADAFTRLQDQNVDQSSLTATAGFLASAAYQDGQLALASRWYEILIQPGVEKEWVGKGLTGLAWIYMKGGDSQRALEHFERILTEFPDTDFAVDAAMARAKQLEDANSFSEALRTYELVVSRTTRTRLANIARLRVAFCAQKLGGAEHLGRAETALNEYLRSSDSQEHTDEAHYQLAWVYHDLKKPESCFSQFEQIAAKYTQSKYWADACYRLAEQRFKQERYDEALELVNQLLQRTNQPEILSRSIYMNGQMAAMRNEWANVAQDMEALIGRCDDKGIYAKASYWLAESLYQQNETAAAADLFGQLVEKNDLLDKAVWPWVGLRNAQCQAKLEAWDTVAAHSQAAIDRFPQFKKNYEHHYLLGRALEKEGRLTDARKQFESVVNSSHGGRTETAAKAQWRIGETHFHQEDYKSAIRAFYKVDSLFTYPRWRTAALYEAGKCQEHLGNWSHAILLYKQLLKDFPKSEFADKATERLSFANRQAESLAKTEKRR